MEILQVEKYKNKTVWQNGRVITQKSELLGIIATCTTIDKARALLLKYIQEKTSVDFNNILSDNSRTCYVYEDTDNPEYKYELHIVKRRVDN